jgi:hypothetical protein
MSPDLSPKTIERYSEWPYQPLESAKWHERLKQGEVSVLLPPSPALYWHSEALQEDPHFDGKALTTSIDSQKKYLEGFKQVEGAPYPPHLVPMPHTGLPAMLNGYLPDFELGGAAQDNPNEQLPPWVQRWFENPDLTLALTGLPPDRLFQAGQGKRPILEGRGWLWLRSPDEAIEVKNAFGFSQRDVLHIRYQQFHADGWPIYGGRVVAHCVFDDFRISASSSYFPLREDVSFEPRLSEEEAWDVAKFVFEHYEEVRFTSEPVISLVPYVESPQFITAYRDRFCLAYRFEAVSEAGDEAWRLFIDAESGLVLGPPEPLIAQANAYYLEDSVAARQPAPQPSIDPNQSLAQLELAIDPYCSGLETAGGTPLILANFHDAQGIPPPSQTEIEAANIAAHTLRTLAHFVGTCGVDSVQLESYGYSYDVWEDDGLGGSVLTTKQGVQAKPLKLIIGATGGNALQMGFVSAEQTNPKTIILQTPVAGQPLTVDGLPVHNPSLDPELICHEAAHAVMWLVNRLPFMESGSSVPCRQALLEGYATYFARSLAARGAGDGIANPAALWAGSVYRENEGWHDRWGVAGSQHGANADSLPGVNLYPAGANVGVGIYDLSMVWARALWDIRSLLAADPAWGPVQGPNMADHLALEGYVRCHGPIINFLIAASGMIDSARKTPALSSVLIAKMQAAFVNRHII